MMLRNAFREASKGHVVLKHTNLDFTNGVMFMTHDSEDNAFLSRITGEPVVVTFAKIAGKYSLPYMI